MRLRGAAVRGLVTATASSSREYDIVLFGSTGFGGKLAAEYFLRHYGGRYRIALAGRDRAKLEAVRDEHAAAFPECAAAPPSIIVADAMSAGDMLSLAAATEVGETFRQGGGF